MSSCWPCPDCSNPTIVTDSRQMRFALDTPYRKRRRRCRCGYAVTTYEVTATDFENMKKPNLAMRQVQKIREILSS